MNTVKSQSCLSMLEIIPNNVETDTAESVGNFKNNTCEKTSLNDEQRYVQFFNDKFSSSTDTTSNLSNEVEVENDNRIDSINEISNFTDKGEKSTDRFRIDPLSEISNLNFKSTTDERSSNRIELSTESLNSMDKSLTDDTRNPSSENFDISDESVTDEKLNNYENAPSMEIVDSSHQELVPSVEVSDSGNKYLLDENLDHELVATSVKISGNEIVSSMEISDNEIVSSMEISDNEIFDSGDKSLIDKNSKHEIVPSMEIPDSIGKPLTDGELEHHEVKCLLKVSNYSDKSLSAGGSGYQRIEPFIENSVSSCNYLTDKRLSYGHFPSNIYVKKAPQVLKVAVLESLGSLKVKCENLGLKFNDCVLSDKAYEVDEEECEKLISKSKEDVFPDKAYQIDLIFSHMLIDGNIYYFVKWKNYTTDTSTWEPASNLTGCQEAITYYHAIESSKPKVNKQILLYFITDLTTRKPYDILTLTKALALCFDCTEDNVNSFHLTISQMKQKVKDFLTFSSSKISKLSDKLLQIMQFGEERKKVLINLKEWESEINLKNQMAYVKVKNDVDLETAPTSFKFIHDYINSIVDIPEEPVAFCHCGNCHENKESCCPKDSEGRFAYSKHRRLILEPGYPIYECNKRCACDSSCVNRVVQHGQKVKVCVFRTSNGCGWGLKTLESIDKGEFVCEYLGEIITSEDAEERGLVYDYIARSYLFDLDYGVDSCSYTVDAGHVGNASHFINHSCDPNLHVFAVWINQPDPNLPRLALFAKRKIKIGEELTFDYQMVQRDRFGPKSALPDYERILCLCNSNNCKKFLF